MRRVWLLALVAISFAGCTARDFASNNRADVILRVNNIEGTAFTLGGTQGTPGEQLFSDVLTCKGKDPTRTCSVLNDDALITLAVVPKNPNATLTSFEDVVLNSYSVQYLRSDGRGVEGVDVPFAISGNISSIITVGGTSQVPIIVVRHQAKSEPPLLGMVGSLGTSLFMTMSAKVTVYGRTTSGKEVSAVGYLEIIFSDFADAS